MRNDGRLVLALAALLLPLVVVPYLQLPFAGEHGIYAFDAWRMSQGEVPYRDFWNMNTPAVFVVHRVADALFGHDMRSIRIFDSLWMLATLFFLHRVVRRAFDPLAANVAMLLAVATYFTLGHQPTAQRDGWCVLPLVAMLDATASLPPTPAGDRRAALVVGLATALAFWLKPPFLLPSAICALALTQRRAAPLVQTLGIGAASFLAVAGFVLLYFWRQDALVDLYENTVLFNASYARDRYSLAEQARIFVGLAFAQPMWLVGIAGCLVALRRPAARPFVAVAIGCAIVVAVQGKLYGYQLVPLRLLLCGSSAGLVAALWRAGRLQIPARALALGIVALATLGAVQAFRLQQFPAIWRELATRGGARVSREEVALAGVLATKTRPDDAILVWGIGTPGTVHYLSERRSPTRFTLSYPFAMPRSDSPLIARWRREFLEALRGAPPRVVVVAGGDAWEGLKNVDSSAAFERFTELRDFVAQRYRPVAHMRGRLDYRIFLRVDPASGSPAPPAAATDPESSTRSATATSEIPAK